MSIVVAIKHKNVIYLGADSLTTSGQLFFNGIKSKSNYKINKLNNDVLVGNVGLASAKQIWVKNAQLFNNLPNNELTKEFIVNTVVPTIRQDMIDAGIMSKTDVSPNNFILARKDKLFVIDENFGVFEINDYIAIGSGRVYGLMHLGDEKPIRDRLLQAIKSPTNHINTVGLPAILINTKDMQYETVKEVK